MKDIDNIFYFVPYNDIDLIKLILNKIDMPIDNMQMLIYKLEESIRFDVDFTSLFLYKNNGIWKLRVNDSSTVKSNKSFFEIVFNLDFRGNLILTNLEIDINKYNI